MQQEPGASGQHERPAPSWASVASAAAAGRPHRHGGGVAQGSAGAAAAQRSSPAAGDASWPARRPSQPASGSDESLLRFEAAKSRPDVRGERRCLACGKAFSGDIQRFLQHLKDAHGGRNAPLPAAPAPSAAWGGRTAAGPSLRSVLQLGDVLLRHMQAPARRPPFRQQQPSPSLHPASRQQQQQQRRQREVRPAVAAPVAAAAAVLPPPGTRQPSRRKRESRLKRAFKRSQATQACSCWQGILAVCGLLLTHPTELEAALQAVSEAQGCLTNQHTAVEQQLSATEGSAEQQAGQQGQEEQLLLRANLLVELQLLEEQQRHATECRSKLECAHAHARSQLAAAQQQLHKVERLPPEPAGTAGEGSGSGECGSGPPAGTGGGASAGSSQEPMAAVAEAAGAAAATPAGAAASGAAAAPSAARIAQEEQPPAEVRSSEQPGGVNSSSGGSTGADEAASEAEAASAASFGFQDVLSSWAAASTKQLPAEGPLQAAVVRRQQQPGPATGSNSGRTAAPAPAKPAVLSVAAVPPATAAPSATASIPLDAAGSHSSESDGGVDAGCSSSSSSGSFGLQWGNQLLSWATAVCSEAAAVAVLAAQAQPQLPSKQLLQLQSQQQAAQRSVRQPEPQQQRQQQQQQQQPAHAVSAPVSADLPAAVPAVVSSIASQPGTASTALGPQHERSAAAGVDVAAWLSSSAAAAVDAPAAGLPAAQAAASEPASAVEANIQKQQQWQQPAPPLQQQVALPPASYVQAAAEMPGAFRCLLCQVTVSGQRNLQEHLSSKRHVRRVAAEASASAASTTGPEAQHGLQLAASAAAGNRGGSSRAGGGGGGGGGGGRTYVGAYADVAPYVNQVITPELNSTAEALLRRLLEWQERARQADPANFKRKRRVVSGMREVEKAVKTRRAKLVLLAPNVAAIEDPPQPVAATSSEAAGVAKGEAADAAQPGEAAVAGGEACDAAGGGSSACPAAALATLAAEREVPLVFALSRQRMGKLLGARKRASAFAVLDANGVFEELRALLVLAQEGRQAWLAAAEGRAKGKFLPLLL